MNVNILSGPKPRKRRRQIRRLRPSERQPRTEKEANSEDIIRLWAAPSILAGEWDGMGKFIKLSLFADSGKVRATS